MPLEFLKCSFLEALLDDFVFRVGKDDVTSSL